MAAFPAVASTNLYANWITQGGAFHPKIWVLRFKRLGIRYDATAITLLPLILLAIALISLRRLRQATKL